MQTIKMKPIHVFAEIERVDEDTRTVEAYAFVNEVVEGEGGIRLKRSSMEEATGDYLKWANVRRMHQPDAVGIAHSVVWDARGAKMVLEVVDDDAWNKVKRGVYKGLSVGVQATLMRGKDVEKCRWIETSLVDRPKDPGAIITAVRAEDAAAEFDVEVEDEPHVVRGIELTDDQFAVVERIIAGADLIERAELTELQTRFEALQVERDAANTQLTEVRTRLESAEAEVTGLRNTPARAPIAKYGTGAPIDRVFLADQQGAETAHVETLQAELKRLSSLPEDTPATERNAASMRISGIRRELAGLGVTA